MPNFEVQIPSLDRGHNLDCRLYYPKNLGDFAHDEFDRQRGFRGAIIAHPLPLFGGTQDDRVVLATTQTLLQCGYITMTFNFRGVGGLGSVSGKAEMEDYISVFGFLTHFMETLSIPEDPNALSPVPSADNANFDEQQPFAVPPRQRRRNHVLLAGYSFGALIMARLPHAGNMIERFTNAQTPSIEAEICGRAANAAVELQKTLDRETRPRGHVMKSSAFQSPERQRQPRTVPSRMMMGGANVDSSGRPRSRDSRRSEEFVRSIAALAPHARKKSNESQRPRSLTRRPTTASTINQSGPIVRVAYLIISPVLWSWPIPPAIIPPGILFGKRYYDDASLGFLSLTCPIFIVYGKGDTWTSSKRLDQWVDKLKSKDQNHFVSGANVEGADHFWGRHTLRTLQQHINRWLRDDLVIAS